MLSLYFFKVRTAVDGYFGDEPWKWTSVSNRLVDGLVTMTDF